MKTLRAFALALTLPLIGVPVAADVRSAPAAEPVEFGSASFTIEPSPFKVKQASKQGITLRYHPEAAREANELIRSFLIERLEVSQ